MSFLPKLVVAALVGSAVAEPAAAGPNPIPGGFRGKTETTRYWDCCLPSFAWNGKSKAVPDGDTVRACDVKGNALKGYSFQSGCIGGNAYMCADQVGFEVSPDLAYGFAAASVIGGTNEKLACTCYKLTFTNTAIAGKSMVVQVTNTGNDLSSNHFDIAIPGGGVGSFDKGCSSQFGGGFSWGKQYGGIEGKENCNQLPASLQKGCLFRYGWFQGADNPSATFEQVVCPREITAISGCRRNDQ